MFPNIQINKKYFNNANILQHIRYYLIRLGIHKLIQLLLIFSFSNIDKLRFAIGSNKQVVKVVNNHMIPLLHFVSIFISIQTTPRNGFCLHQFMPCCNCLCFINGNKDNVQLLFQIIVNLFQNRDFFSTWTNPISYKLESSILHVFN